MSSGNSHPPQRPANKMAVSALLNPISAEEEAHQRRRLQAVQGQRPAGEGARPHPLRGPGLERRNAICPIGDKIITIEQLVFFAGPNPPRRTHSLLGTSFSEIIAMYRLPPDSGEAFQAPSSVPPVTIPLCKLCGRDMRRPNNILVDGRYVGKQDPLLTHYQTGWCMGLANHAMEKNLPVPMVYSAKELRMTGWA